MCKRVYTQKVEGIRMLFVSANKLFLFFKGQKKIDWHDNLKALLVRKAFLVYVTLAEAFYSEENYGQCVKLLKRALNCYFCFLKISDHAKVESIEVLNFRFLIQVQAQF